MYIYVHIMNMYGTSLYCTILYYRYNVDSVNVDCWIPIDG